MTQVVTVVAIRGLDGQIGVLAGSAERNAVETLVRDEMKQYVTRKYPDARIQGVEFFWPEKSEEEGLRVVRVRRTLVGKLPHLHSGDDKEIDDIHYLVQTHKVRKW